MTRANQNPLRPWLRLAATLFCAWLAASAAAAAPAKPNILYILADDMGYADAGFMGCQDIQTPHLDKLARGGAILKSFYVQPVCSPTRAALMTGRYAVRTGVYTVVRPNAPWGLKLEERTLAQALQAAGYETAIDGKWHLGEFQPAYRPLQRGFDHQYGLWFGMIDYFTHKRGAQLDWHRDDQPCLDAGYSTHLLAQEACRLIRAKHPDKPLFLYLPFNAVHGPYQVPERYCAPYAKLQGVRRTYAGMVAALDEAVGQVLAALDEKGLRQNTLVIFSSDNGGPAPGKVTSNGPLRAGKGTLYEGGVRVCACVNWPGHIPAGAVINEPLHAVDWYPTLVKLAGGSLEPSLPLDGRDIWPVLTQGAKSPHEALLLCGTRPGQAALRMGDWKLLVGASDKDAEENPAEELAVGGKVALYNLAADLGEQKNLAAAQPAKVKELRARLDAFMKTALAPGQNAATQEKKAN
jgi:arylsulfatase A-like enzyme